MTKSDVHGKCNNLPLREEAVGRLLSPLIIWNGTIVDGHNRYRILLEHPEIDYETLDKDFPDRFAASAWICKNQLGRRNLTPEQRIYLIEVPKPPAMLGRME